MINSKSTPLEWSTFMYELEDAKEHLQNLIQEMNKSGNIDEIDFSIQLGHVYAHLNRAWNSRDYSGETKEEE